MIRWYILRGPEPPTQIIEAPDKVAAQRQADAMGLGIGVISVLEYEEVQREIRERRAWLDKMTKHFAALQMLDTTINAEAKERPDLFAADTTAQAVECVKLVSVVRGEFYHNAMVGLGLEDRYGEGRVA